MNETSVTAVVPMRHSSERVPGKNYRHLGGRPLYHHVVASLLEAPSIAEVVIDTDSDLIRTDCASVFGDAVRVVERPPHLRDGMTAMNDVLLHTLQSISSDVVIQTHSTSPFVRSSTFEAGVRHLVDQPDVDSVFSVTRLQARLWTEEIRPVNHDPAELLRTQDLAPLFIENSAFFVFRRKKFLETKNRLSGKLATVEMSSLESLDIDVESDFQHAEAIAAGGIL